MAVTKAQALVGSVASLTNIEFDASNIESNETLAFIGSQVLSSDRITNDFLSNMLNKVGTTLLRQRVFNNRQIGCFRRTRPSYKQRRLS